MFTVTAELATLKTPVKDLLKWQFPVMQPPLLPIIDDFNVDVLGFIPRPGSFGERARNYMRRVMIHNLIIRVREE